MFKARTVFIIGAGASAEAGLPCGRAFKEQIADRLLITFNNQRQTHGDRDIVEALRNFTKLPISAGDLNDYRRAAIQISSAMPQATSIDFYLDHHKDNRLIEVCGKLAIVQTILSAEHVSRLFMGPSGGKSIDFRQLENTWYGDFWKILTIQSSKENIETLFDNVTFIVFNYDRCIEHFLYISLQNYSRLPQDRASEIIKNLRIFHPYGTVGSLPWHHEKNSVPFGTDELQPMDLVDLAQGIKTFTESIDEGEEIAAIRSAILNAQTIVFLGFAFHSPNMKLIQPQTPSENSKNIFASIYGISANDRRIIENSIRTLHGRRNSPSYIGMEGMECHRLFEEYWHHFSEA